MREKAEWGGVCDHPGAMRHPSSGPPFPASRVALLNQEGTVTTSRQLTLAALLLTQEETFWRSPPILGGVTSTTSVKVVLVGVVERYRSPTNNLF